MPYKSEKIPLGKYDRRVKLSNIQREEIKELRKLGLSYKVIADRYEVSKSLIILVCSKRGMQRFSILHHRLQQRGVDGATKQS